MGLLRVDAAGEEAVRGPGRGGVQPGHGAGRRAGAHRRRRDAGGRGGPGDAVVYSQGTGRAAALVPTGDGGTLEVAAVLGMRWKPGKLVSGRSLRGLRPLAGGA